MHAKSCPSTGESAKATESAHDDVYNQGGNSVFSLHLIAKKSAFTIVRATNSLGIGSIATPTQSQPASANWRS